MYNLPLPVFFVVVFSLLLFFFWLGTYVKNKISDEKQDNGSSTLVVEATLLSLLIGFTFNMAASKFDRRKTILNEEINNLSTVIMLTDLYPDSIQSGLKHDMSAYLETRISYYEAGTDERKIRENRAKADSVSHAVFKKIAEYSKKPGSFVYSQQMIPAVLRMMDSLTSREVYRKSSVPLSVMRFLLVLSIVVSFVSGLNQPGNKLSWWQAVGYSVLISISFLLIIDFNSQRKGQIDFKNEHQAMLDMRKQLDE